MNVSNDLLHLIGAMTSQEKRYFKLYAAFYNKNAGNHCLQLFDSIERYKPANDTELEALVRDKPYGRRLAALKNQLMELVLDSLAAFHASRQESFKLRRLLTHAEILYNKGLYNHCRKLLARAEKKAVETQYYDFMPEIFTSKRALLIKEVSDSFEQDIEALYKNNDTVLALLLSTNSYLKLMDLMQVIAARYAVRPTDEDIRAIKAIAEHPLLNEETQAETFGAQLARYNTLGTYSLLINDIEQATEYYRNAVHLWKQSPALIRQRPSQYRRYLLNYLNCLLTVPNEEEFISVTRDIKALPFPFPEQEPAALATIWNIELLYYLNRGELDKGAEVIAEVEKGLTRHADVLLPTTYITLCYNSTMFYFLAGNYRKALEYVNAILNERRIEIKRDLHDFARVLGLITHYELHNIDILDNMLRSTRRFLRQRDTVGGLENIVLCAIKDLLFSVDQTSEQHIFRSLYKELTAIIHSSDNQELPGMTELLFWTESKLRKRPIDGIFVEKIKVGSNMTPQTMFPLDPAFMSKKG